MIFPTPLKSGDLVTILSPSSKIDKDLVHGQKERLESWGLQVKIAPHALSKHHSFAGTRAQRLTDLQKALDDPRIRAVFCSRGGYGAIHLLEAIDLTRFRETPKWLIGYSDITALHSLLQKEGFASVHGIMGRHLAKEPADDPQIQALHSILFGDSPSYRIPEHKFNRPGTANGILRGGNLSVLYGLRGTPYDFPAKGTILFLEDIGERVHHLERMMYNLKFGGILENLSGLLVGQFTESTQHESIGKALYEMIHDLIKPYSFPVSFNFPVGHVVENVPLITGSSVCLKITKKETILSPLGKDL